MLKFWSKTQAVVALSSAEAELGAAVKASQEVLGMMTLWWSGGGRLVGKGLHHTSLHAPRVDAQAQSLELFLFPSLPGPVVGEMPSAARYTVVGMVGRPFSHVVRDVLCEGDEGTAEVQEQHRYPPSASAVRESSGNCCG